MSGCLGILFNQTLGTVSFAITTTILEQDKQFSLTLLAEGTGCCTYDWD
jgi:hypothetical protein